MKNTRYIIGVTGNVLNDDTRVFLTAGVDAIILKPLKVNDLDLLFAYLREKGLRSDPSVRLRISGGKVKVVPLEEAVASYFDI